MASTGAAGPKYAASHHVGPPPSFCMSAQPRPEGIRFPQATWTSFDRYGRYAAIVEAVRASLGPGVHRVLDVGDSAGHLHLFDPGLEVVGLDVNLATDPLPATVAVQADGTRLPFGDGAFDAVVSSDVLEHIVPAGRAAFLTELSRVSRDLVVVAAPFDTAGVAGCEDLARRYALFSAEAPQPQLEEHRDNGLPSLAATVAVLEADGASVVTAGNGNLWDWLLMMVLRFQLEARPDLRPLSEGYDVWYNQALADRADVGPFYRHLAVARRLGPPQVGPGPAAPATDLTEAAAMAPGELAPLLAALIAADSTEVVRHDARVAARATDVRFDELGHRLDHLGERLEALIELEVSMAERFSALYNRLGRVMRPFRRDDKP
jgi:SAM-dependent methyltransferase